jgi:SAM-dependent methyltransferase
LDPKYRKYRREYGRRYHSFEGAPYRLPNDRKEIRRLKREHRLFRRTIGELSKAPLLNDLYNVLDIGTGPGKWAIEFADKYSSARVYGTDLSPIQPKCVPPNCYFYLENAENSWSFLNIKFCYIHVRMLSFSIRSWKYIFGRAFNNLKLGGFIEVVEPCFPIICEDPCHVSLFMEWMDMITAGAMKGGFDIKGVTRFAALLTETGFVDVSCETHNWLIGRLSKDETKGDKASETEDEAEDETGDETGDETEDETEDATEETKDEEKTNGELVSRNFLDGFEAHSLAFTDLGLEEIQVFRAKVRTDLMKENRSLETLPISVVWARKPDPGTEHWYAKYSFYQNPKMS